MMSFSLYAKSGYNIGNKVVTQTNYYANNIVHTIFSRLFICQLDSQCYQHNHIKKSTFTQLSRTAYVCDTESFNTDNFKHTNRTLPN